jgi:hypothetical protein
VPADYGLWFHDEENIAPAGPDVPKRGPEESVEGMQLWPRAFAFEDSDLLPEGEDLKGRVGTAAEKDPDHREDGENALNHGITVITEGRPLIASNRRENSNH